MRPMSAANNTRIILELEPGADPIRGNIEQENGPRQRFWGWLELIDGLRRAAANEPGRPGQPFPVDAEPSSEPAAHRQRPDTHTKEQR